MAQPPVQRSADAPAPAPAAASRSPSGIGGGEPLPSGVRGFMEPRFGASFGNVRVHTDAPAARLSADLGAHAFTVGEHIYFGRDKFQPQSASGRELIAHELTHTIQQGAAIQRSAEAAVSQRSEPRIQRFGWGSVLEWVADKARFIPGFTLFTIVLGMNPITMAPVERSAANILRGLLELIPVTGPLLAQVLDSYGIFAKAGAWVELQVRQLGLAGGAIKAAVDKFIASVGLKDIFTRPGELWETGKRIFTAPIDKLLAFAGNLANDIIGFVREAVLFPLARLAEGTRGYDLLKAVLGQDPITGQPVPRTPETLIGGFMKLIGQEEIWENLKKANAVTRAWAWFQGALAGLMGFVRQVPGMIVAAIKSLELADFLLLPKAYIKVAGAFGGFIMQFLAWAGNTMWTLLEIIFEVVSPATLVYLRKTGAALKSILLNPLPFMGNLIRAAKLGLQNFVENFGTHLKSALIEWLTGSLPGVYIPKSFSLGEIVKFIFSVLGLTWANIRPKLVKVVGETAVKAMETGFDIVVTLVTQGPAAAWDKIQEHLANLKDQVISGIIGMVTETVIKKAIPKLVAMFIPGAGFISAIITIWDTIMVFVEKLKTMAQVVMGFVDSIVAIAAGQIESAAKTVENSLVKVLSLAISFLAGFIGLGSVADKVMEVITKVRAVVDKGIDALIAWIVKMAKALFAKAKAGVAAVAEWWKQKKPFTTKDGHGHELSFEGDEKTAVPMVASNTKKKVTDQCDQFGAQAAAPEATEEQKKAAALIAATKALAVKAPNDENLIVNLGILFDKFQGGIPQPMTIERQTGSLGGSTVGLSVTVDWLGPKHPEGSPPADSAQTGLMDLLVTDPKKSSPDKFVRGHLLNEHLGGPGTDINLFPITGKANSQHLQSTERDVKKWVIDEKKYARYEVKVLNVSSKLDAGAKHPANYVNSVFACRYVLKEASGKQVKEVVTAITSEYTQRTDFLKEEVPASPPAPAAKPAKAKPSSK